MVENLTVALEDGWRQGAEMFSLESWQRTESLAAYWHLQKPSLVEHSLAKLRVVLSQS
jgi:hypothetical protein